MTRRSLLWSAGAALLVSITGVTSARAQTVPITFVGDERVVSIQAQGWADPSQKAECGASCTVELVPGKYSLMVTTPDGQRLTTKLWIRRPSVITVQSPNRAVRGVGMALTIIGGLAGAVGLVMFYYAAPLAFAESHGCVEAGDCDKTNNHRWMVSTGLGGMIGGPALAGIGAMILQTTERPTIHVAPLVGGAERDHASLWLRPGLGAGWTGLELGGRF